MQQSPSEEKKERTLSLIGRVSRRTIVCLRQDTDHLRHTFSITTVLAGSVVMIGKVELQSWAKIMGQFATFISNSFSASSTPRSVVTLLSMYSRKDPSWYHIARGRVGGGGWVCK